MVIKHCVQKCSPILGTGSLYKVGLPRVIRPKKPKCAEMVLLPPQGVQQFWTMNYSLVQNLGTVPCMMLHCNEDTCKQYEYNKSTIT